MKKKKIIIYILLFAFLFLQSICFASDKLKVFVSIMPQKYFADKIGGELLDVFVMVKPGENPATYEPKPSQMKAICKAKIYFATGVFFEKAWLAKFSSINPDMKICYADKGIEKISMMKHMHKADENHKNHPAKIKDPHIWLSPNLVKIQAKNMLKALINEDSKNRETYLKNYDAFIKEIENLDGELRFIFNGMKNKKNFMVFHPAWGYFAKNYGLTQIPIEIEGKAPKASQLKDIIIFAKVKNIKTIFVQPQFSTTAAKVIAKQINAKIVFADPLAYDWKDNLFQAGKSFYGALK
jgi:zinc transport system substrate-binding protein